MIKTKRCVVKEKRKFTHPSYQTDDNNDARVWEKFLLLPLWKLSCMPLYIYPFEKATSSYVGQLSCSKAISDRLPGMTGIANKTKKIKNLFLSKEKKINLSINNFIRESGLHLELSITAVETPTTHFTP